MNASKPFTSVHKYAWLDIASFCLGIAALIFPAVSAAYLVTENGGPGYLASLFNGIPVALIAIILGIAALVKRKNQNQTSHWMAISGIVIGSLSFLVALIMILVLLFPFFTGNAH